ncbi:TetR/AcrR family transcriptional regulator [Ligilactobacillus acidipiscis]|uniref:TetR/AcrR family transcriptional regulator n=1 Tax=Ligilactobacillus acidipiscis TaxID=89059 RepID=UPI0022E1738A|nr:TetR/AcrR family transcriptional regulator [Ligilactobacillus acidipiscis]
MKYTLHKKMTRGQQRTLNDFSTTLIKLIQQKSVESVTVNEICQEANYPRATFYNYFTDKYDLLEYCWHLIVISLQISEKTKLDPYEAVHLYFGRLYDLFSAKKDILVNILHNNDVNGQTIMSFSNYLKQIINVILRKIEPRLNEQMPQKLIAAYLTETIMLILSWIFLEQHDLSKKEAIAYLDNLLKE